MADAPQGAPALARSAPVERAVLALTVLSSLALAVMLAATFAGVVLRYVFAAPLLGGNEIVQLSSVALVMMALPAAAQSETHIRVDVLDRAIGRIGRVAGDFVSRGISILVLALLVRRAWTKMRDAAEFGDATNMLAIPLWPFYALIVLGGALYAVVLAIQIVDLLRTGARGQ